MFKPTLLLALSVSACAGADAPGSSYKPGIVTEDTGSRPASEPLAIRTDCEPVATVGDDYACRVWVRLEDGSDTTDVAIADAVPGATLTDGSLLWTPEARQAGTTTLNFVAGTKTLAWTVTVADIYELAAGTVAADGSLNLEGTPTHVLLDRVVFNAAEASMPAGTAVTLYELVGPPWMMPAAPSVVLARDDGTAVRGVVTLYPSPSARGAMGLSDSAELMTALYDPVTREWTDSAATATDDGGLVVTLAGGSNAAPPPDVFTDIMTFEATVIAVLGTQFMGGYRAPELKIPGGETEFVAGERNCLLVHGINSDYTAFYPPEGETDASSADVGEYAVLRCQHVMAFNYGWGRGAIQNGLALQTALGSLDVLQESATNGGAIFTVLAHSNGGLITRSMLDISGGPPYPGQLHALVTLDTPHLGGTIELLSDLAEAVDTFPVQGIQDLLASTVDTEGSFLHLLNSEDVGEGGRYCIAALNEMYYPERTDGLVSVDSALAACDTTQQLTVYNAHAMWLDTLPDAWGTHSWVHETFLTNLASVQVDRWLGWDLDSTACSNYSDDDGDGWIDLDDPGCAADAGGEDEGGLDPTLGCNDGVDNDGDGATDTADIDCADATRGEAEPPETCDDGVDNDRDGDTDCDDEECATDLSCPWCGNGATDSGEACDLGDVNGNTCVDAGWDYGTLACDASCVYDETGCLMYSPEVCDDRLDSDGDGSVDCDDADCTSDSACILCGNGTIDTGEDCDGTDLAGLGCTDRAYDAGTLACNSACSYDESGCVVYGVEVCDDGSDNDGDGAADCADPGCVTDARCPGCGNGVVDGGEDCDGAELGGLGCADLGFIGGTLGCDAACALDTSACSETEACEDGVDNDLDGSVDCDDSECASLDLDCVDSHAPGGETDLDDALARVDGETDAQNVFAWWRNVGSDVTGDGIHDLAVEAFDDTSGPASAHVFAGPRPLTEGRVDPSSADITVSSSAASDAYPIWPGDFDGDGEDDLGIYDGCGDVPGCTEAFALFRGPVSPGTWDVTDAAVRILGSEDASMYWIEPSGDVDGDGFRDLLIGDPYDDGTASNAGATWVVAGGSSWSADQVVWMADLSPVLTLQGVEARDEAGSMVTDLGDLDGDGLHEVGVGAANVDGSGGSSAGAVYVVLGGLTGTASLADADAVITGTAAYEDLRNSAGVGDVDGDGVADFSVGADEAGESYDNEGAAWLFTRLPSGTVLASNAETAIHGDDGDSVDVFAPLGDVDGDGFDDLGNNAGSTANLWYGPLPEGTLGSSDADASFAPESFYTDTAEESYSGWATAVGDLDGDGFAEIAVGFSHSASPSAGESFEGEVFIFRGGSFLVEGDGTCSDGDDDDADGLVDSADPDCVGRDGSEYPSVESACDDGLDDDGDGTLDCDDWNCVNVVPCVESTCDDGMDDDGDGTLDCDDVDCVTAVPCLPACSNTLDDDGDGWIDGDDPACGGDSGTDEDAFDAAYECNNGTDDDGDGAIDADDPDCGAGTLPESDGDGDGYGPTVDCDDADASFYPSAPDAFGDGIDQDCDGVGGGGGGTAVDALSAGALVVSEVLQNPSAVPDADGEWFEIYNASGGTVELEGLRVSDLGSESFQVTGSLSVVAGGSVLFGISGDVEVNGGVAPDYVYSDLVLSNADDELILSNASGVIDQVGWDGWPLFPDPTGASMTLNPDSLDATSNDDGANWCEATSLFGDGDLGTPGSANDGC